MGRVFKVVFNRPVSLFFFFYYESEWLTINNNARELLKNNTVINSVQNRTEIRKKNPHHRSTKKIWYWHLKWCECAWPATHLWKYRTTASASKGKDPFGPQQPWGKSHISVSWGYFFLWEDFILAERGYRWNTQEKSAWTKSPNETRCPVIYNAMMEEWREQT